MTNDSEQKAIDFFLDIRKTNEQNKQLNEANQEKMNDIIKLCEKLSKQNLEIIQDFRRAREYTLYDRPLWKKIMEFMLNFLGLVGAMICAIGFFWLLHKFGIA